ncbi:MAG: DUF72 domain-containing protein [Planctomycetota bacterium]
MSDQLRLFQAPDDDATIAARATDAALEARRAEAAAVASRLPDTVHFGTSSWAFPGWTGLVYPTGLTPTALSREGLRHYARHPLLRTVGVDRSYYAPIPLDDLRAYADQLPDGFRACFKAPASVTSRLTPTFGGRGAHAPNPDFLSVDRFIADLLEPLYVALHPHTGPIVIECPPGTRESSQPVSATLDALDAFFERLPREFEYALEIRDAALLTPAYRALLARHEIAHTFNYWSAMPSLVRQAAIVPPDEAAFTVLRLLLRPGTWYEDQRDRFKPFSRLVDVDETMRDEVVQLTTRALAKGRRVYVLVNNKAEGSSPLTVEALAARVAAAWDPRA